MNDYFIWNGTNTHTLGITVKEFTDIVFPAPRCTFTKVPGRNGYLASTEGDDVYDDVTLSATCYVKDMSNIIEIAKVLRGAGTLRIPSRPDGYYKARIINQIPFEKIVRGNTAHTFVVNFRCNPLFRLDSGDVKLDVKLNQTIQNPTGIKAFPRIQITGNLYYTTTFMIGTQMFKISKMEGKADDKIIIDSELQEAYYENISLNSHMSGDFPVLTDSLNAISWSGAWGETVHIKHVEIMPRWVTL